MATGTPKTLKRSERKPRGQAATVEVSYPGKQPLASLLKAPAGNFHEVRHGNSDRRLYFAENRSALAALAKDESVRGKVKLVYIDPPYATQTVFQSRMLIHAYEDVFETAEYLEFLRERLALLHQLLASDGSIYLHIDDKMLFHTKLLMDEIFGPGNFRNCITRKKCNPKNYTRKAFGNTADYILFYTKSASYIWNRISEPWTKDRAKEYQYVEPETGRQYMKVPVHAPGVRFGETGQPWRGKLPPPGKHWQYSPSNLDKLDANGEIFWSSNGNPRRKVYLDQSSGVSVQDIWLDFKDAHNQNVHITGYPTEKNIELLKRILDASSNPGDLVLDCFAGSGTTLVAAEMLGRNWIGIDNSEEALRTMLHRFVHGTQAMGDFVAKRDYRAPLDEATLFAMEPEVPVEPGSATSGLCNQDFTLLTSPENASVVATIQAGISAAESPLIRKSPERPSVNGSTASEFEGPRLF